MVPLPQNQPHDESLVAELCAQYQARLERARNILRPALNSKHAIDLGRLPSDKSMKLLIEGVVVAENPSTEELANDLARLDGELNTFAILELNDWIYLQTAYSGKEGFQLEFQDGSVNKHYCCADKVSLEGLINAFQSFARGEKEWQEAYDWRLMDTSGGEAPTGQRIERENKVEGQSDRFEEYNAAVVLRNPAFKADYESHRPDSVERYCRLVLAHSRFGDHLLREFYVEYIPETKILIVDHALPAPDELSHVKEIRYLKSEEKFVEKLLSEGEFNQIYDNILYQTCLRTVYELFDGDTAGALDAVAFNGWVKSIDRATGRDTNGCVLSVQATKEEFQKINLARVDSKACFKAFKGIGSSTLHKLTPIAPVLRINREDRRFVASHEVVGQLDERFNLAAMDWEDFEHLVRELFEKEFSKSGSEVKVTRASRDGGVDAVVFDPDPIHGGKTVIQAKRYTNTVGVAAVRELYGAVINEGAMKGILVTTADYGPDAYEFAADKPLVLLNGGNLLNLLEKHGHKAKIDLQEAKRILEEKV